MVSVPKAAVDEDGGTIFAKHDVGFARHAFHIEAVAVAVTPQPATHQQFGLGVLASDVRHDEVTL